MTREEEQKFEKKTERITEKEMGLLEKEDEKIDPNAKTEHSGDSLLAALELLDHLEDQKSRLEQRESVKRRYHFSERLADKIASFGGSWRFIIFFFCFMALWMLLNGIAWMQHWDPYPFILLNLMLSTLAALQAPVILMSQNRQAERDRYRDEIDFERDRLDLKVDTLAAKTIREATVKISHIERELVTINAKLDALAPKKSKKRKR